MRFVNCHIPLLVLLLIMVTIDETKPQGTSTVIYRSSNALPTPPAHALHEFAFEMFRKLLEAPESGNNILFSPLSMYSIFTALLPGLDGTSLDEVRRLLRADHLSNVTVEESEMTNQVFGLNNPLYTMEHTQRLFIDKRIRLRKEFKRLTEGYHQALIKKLDFQSSPETCRNKINKYVAKKTREDIPNMLEENSVNTDTKLILVNTIFMQAPWKKPFPKSSTSIKPFHVSSNEQIDIPFMFNKEGECSKPLHSNQLKSDAVVIPFESNALVMVIIMPTIAGDFSSFEEASATDNVKEILERLWLRQRPTFHSCRLAMPKFAIDYKVSDMKSILNGMGVRDLFTEGSADLSRLTSNGQMFVSDVQHATALKTTEEGVQASTAAAFSTVWKSIPYFVTLNKPFVFLIRHEVTGSVIFLGKITRPTLK